MGWIDTCKQNSFEDVAHNLGLTLKGKRWTPCPNCNAEFSGSNDKRPPVGTFKISNDSTGWRCFVCGEGGDMMDLVSFSIEGQKCRDVDDYSRIKEFFKTFTFASIEVTNVEKEQIPEQDLARLWNEIRKNEILQTSRKDIQAFLSSRGIDHKKIRDAYSFPNAFRYDTLTKVKTSSGRMMPFWPFKWANEYPIAVPLFDFKGGLKSFQGRAIKDLDGKPKTMCPISFSMSGLFFADQNMRDYLKGEKSFAKFWITEGEMDFLSILSKQDHYPVMGIKNGSFVAFKQFKFPAGAEVVIATDNDEKGDEYAAKIAKRIYPIIPKRLVLDSGDVNDFLMEKEYADLADYVKPFPNIEKILGERGLDLLRNTFYKLEKASRSERINSMTDLFDHIEILVLGAKAFPTEFDKWYFRTQSIHGCSSVAKKLQQAIALRMKGNSNLDTAQLANDMVSLEGPDENVELMRKPIIEKGCIIGYGKILPIELNLISILQNDRRMKGRFKYNEFKAVVEIDGEATCNNHVMKISIWIQKHYEGFRMDPNLLGKCINYVAGEPGNSYHPVQDILNNLHGMDLSDAPDIARPENLFTHYFRAEETDLNKEYGKLFCKCFVKRQLQPGCKSDYMTIFIGPQGAGKSIASELLALDKKFFARGDLDLKSKDSKLVLQGTALYELDECDTLLSHGYRTVKGFITSTEWKIRKPYDAHVSEIPCSTVLTGATNDEHLEFLSDPTGSRRYCSMLVGIDGMIRIDELRRDLPYIYARAMHSFHGTGEYAEQGPDHQNWLTEEWSIKQQRNNQRFATTDPWIPFVAGHCKRKWNEWHNASGLREPPKKVDNYLNLTMVEILQDVLNIPIVKQDRKVSLRVGDILTQLGCTMEGQKRLGKKRVRVWRVPKDFEVD